MCGCECCISANSVHSTLLSWHDCYLEKLKNQIYNAQNRRSGEMENSLLETYTNSVMPHGKHIFNTASAMDMATICEYP